MVATINTRELTLDRFLKGRNISRSTGYKWFSVYQDELARLGYIKINRVGKGKRILILEPEEVIKFFKEKDIIL